MQKIAFLILIGLFTCFEESLAQQKQVRTSISFQTGWFFCKGEVENAASPTLNHDSWQVVSIPHTWNDKDVLADGKRGYYRGIGWYRKSFSIPDSSFARYYLHFEGVNQVTEVYVNGKKAGSHVGGYTAFNVDITNFIDKKGLNTLAIQVDNSHHQNIPPLSADFTFFGGIYRNVHLISTQNVHFTMDDYASGGIYMHSKGNHKDSMQFHLKAIVSNHRNISAKRLKVSAEIFDKSLEAIWKGDYDADINTGSSDTFFIHAAKLPAIQLWSTDNPYLYQVRVRILDFDRVVDERWIPFGFRYFDFDPDTGFSLNGKDMKLMGANRHQDRMTLGNALTDDMHRKDMAILKSSGANFLRTAHYPQSKAVLQAADELGLLVWEEIPIVNEVTISEAFKENSLTMMKEMIRQHYNHPSIIIWAYMNEIYWMHRFKDPDSLAEINQFTLELAKDLESLTRAEDEGRYTAMAMHNYPAYEATAIGDIPMIAAWNLYHGWYYEEYNDFGRFMDAQKKKHPDRIHIISEFGAGSDLRIHTDNPYRFDFSNRGQVDFTNAFMKQIHERPYIAGGAIWNLVDFSSERRVDATSHMNNKGILTADRQPKDAFFQLQSYCQTEPFLQLGESHRSVWYHVAEHESDTLHYFQLPAFTNLDSLTWFVNGRQVAGTGSGDRLMFLKHYLPAGKYTITCEAGGISQSKNIEIKSIPFHLKAFSEIKELAINLGSNYDFYDTISSVHWIREKPYEKGSWGYLGGEPLFIANKIGTKEDILGIDIEDPLYQTIRIDIKGFRFDLPAGKYEIELLMTDYFPQSRRFADVDTLVTRKPGERIFDIKINGHTFYQNLDLSGEYGWNVPFRFKSEIFIKEEENLHISFHPHEGKTLLSGIKLRKL